MMKHSLSLALAAIFNRPLQSILSALSVAAAIALLTSLFLLTNAIEEGIARNAKNVDIIVGAKGSPLQLVLSSLYQADIPTGNIEQADAQAIAKSPHVRKSIPLVMGDNYKGWRVIGSTPDYLSLYGAVPESGRIFAKPYEVSAGSATGLKIGEKFAAAHGFAADSDDVHDAHLYEVVGVLKPTGTVLDKMLITPVESVQQLHAHHDEHEDGHEGHHHDESAEEEAAEEAMAHQVTAVLLQVRSPIDAMNLPRQINKSGTLQAAVPAYEMSRLSKNLGLGENLVLALSGGIALLSLLMLFFSLAWGLSTRQYDLAVIRVLGASRGRVFATVMLEGMVIGGGGALLGVIMGHLLAYAVAVNMNTLQGFVIASDLLVAHTQDALLILFGLIVGGLAALLPALSAVRLDISSLLARGT